MAPGPFTSTICATPSIIVKCGELYPYPSLGPSLGPSQRSFPVAVSYAASEPEAEAMTRSPTTSGELDIPHSGIFLPVSVTALRDHSTDPSRASSAFRIPVPPSV